ncbi:DUF6470 family protein [Cohnella fermenti]|uniref:Uncharacterized protein n=1 Tax=Cohnella fermenti TaxID=2565925 RepID=A0A4S4BZS4_9BACL|nr:DUF6470 family protein [Cohnella fermenti]THF80807.1 hypothetical protein E6C55_10005 [Cohnella fermenti]
MGLSINSPPLPSSLWSRSTPNMSQVSPSGSVDASYKPADLQVKLKAPEISGDWTQVWKDLGLLKPISLAENQAGKAEAEGLQDISTTVNNGDRIRDNLAKGNIGVYGQINFQTYMREGATDVTVKALPRHTANIDIRVYPPEIHIKANTQSVGLPEGK